MREGHISKAFDGALAALHMRVLEMGGLVHEQVRQSSSAFTEWDAAAAELVVDRESEVAAYDRAFSQEHMTLIARRHPVASDLRAVVGLSKVVAELERSDTEARKIARTVLQQQGGRPQRATSVDVRHTASLATSLFRNALDALDSLDTGLAEQVIARDADLEAEYAAGLRRLLTRAMEDPRHLQAVIESAFVLKSLEHIGDYARNIAQHVLAMAAEGEARRQASSTEQNTAGEGNEPHSQASSP
ncbi:MAG TPA: phosphate signaling complex protein PhoU, partial [Steroidobacteraceae bacterium]|nr:phosphate signaling complex protein PhoU [Steroidobacteraceae bacterium]